MSDAAPKRDQSALIIIVSGAVLAVASFLQWASAEATVNGKHLQSFTVNGLDDVDGKITLVCGIIAIVAGLMWMRAAVKPKAMAVLALIAGIVAVGIGLIYFSTLDVSDEVPASFTAAGGKIDTSAGIGLWLALIAAVGVLVGGIMLVRRAPQATTATPAPPPESTPPAAS